MSIQNHNHYGDHYHQTFPIPNHNHNENHYRQTVQLPSDVSSTKTQITPKSQSLSPALLLKNTQLERKGCIDLLYELGIIVQTRALNPAKRDSYFMLSCFLYEPCVKARFPKIGVIIMSYIRR